MAGNHSQHHHPRAADITVRELQAALAGLEFGSVVITVHHGRIVQIERREKVRLDPRGTTPQPGPTPTDAD